MASYTATTAYRFEFNRAKLMGISIDVIEGLYSSFACSD